MELALVWNKMWHSLNMYFDPQGTYVLQDNKFALLTQFSNGKQYLDQAPKVQHYHPVHSNKSVHRC